MSIYIEIVTGVILNNRELHFSSDGTHKLYNIDNKEKIKFRASLKLLSERSIKCYGLDPSVVHHVFVFNKENYKKITQYFDIGQGNNVDEIFNEFNIDARNPKYFIKIV